MPDDIPKLPVRDLPKPEKRKGFSARDVAAVFIKFEARCAKCSVKVKLDGYAIDHIVRLDALGKHELPNWQLLCVPCHAVKTADDQRASAKGRRLRGKTCNGPKRPIPQPKVSALSSKSPGYVKRKLQSRGSFR